MGRKKPLLSSWRVHHVPTISPRQWRTRVTKHSNLLGWTHPRQLSHGGAALPVGLSGEPTADRIPCRCGYVSLPSSIYKFPFSQSSPFHQQQIQPSAQPRVVVNNTRPVRDAQELSWGTNTLRSYRYCKDPEPLSLQTCRPCRMMGPVSCLLPTIIAVQSVELADGSSRAGACRRRPRTCFD
jgi:hypothetical protein